jgi:hypothetical protein
MIKRFGQVIGWLGDVVGGLFVVAGVTNYFQLYDRIVGALSGNKHVYDPVVVAQLNYLLSENADNIDQLSKDQLWSLHWAENAARQSEIEKLLLMVGVGIAIVLVARAFRYIIAGKD